MNYWNHVKADFIIAIFFTIFCLQTFQTSEVLTLVGLHITIAVFSITAFWIGAIPHALILTCDLDSESSIVTKLLGPFNIFEPFTEFGHREALHHWFWGPFILIGIWLMPALYFGVGVSGWTVFGAVLMLWTHIGVDIVYSGTKRIVPKWMQKIGKKVL